MRKVLLALALVVSLSPALLASTGRDVTYGYTWKDQLEPGIVRIDYTYDAGSTTVAVGSDALVNGLPLPWNFMYYGNVYNSFQISENGWIGLQSVNTNSENRNKTIPNTGTPQNFLAPIWDDIQGMTTARYGLVDGGNAFMIEFGGYVNPVQGTLLQTFWVQVILYRDYGIRFQWVDGYNNGSTTMGIENADGTDGVQLMYNNSTGADGFTVNPHSYDVVVEFVSPPQLRCAGATPLLCPSNQGYTLPAVAPLPNNRTYVCGAKDYTGYEKVFTITLPQLMNFNATISGFAGDLDVFLLSGCNETMCLYGGGDTIDAPLLGAGTYYLVVDGTSASPGQAFNLSIDCQSASTAIACGGSAPGNTFTGTSVLNGYACTAVNLDGNEVLYEVTMPANGNLVAHLATGNQNLDLVLFNSSDVSPGGCIAYGDQTLGAYALPAGNYIVAVEGRNLFSGAYTLEVTCDVRADCTQPVATLNCGDLLTSQTTAGGQSRVLHYSCNADDFPGNEVVYQLNVAATADVTVKLSNAPLDAAAFILSSCNEGTCFGGGVGSGCEAQLAAGSYLIVVDSQTTIPANFDISVTCTQPFNRWSVCEDPVPPQSFITDTSDTEWHLSDRWYCISDARHRNYAARTCTFAMYIVANCGTEMHMPLYDVESGDLIITDLQTGQPVQLTAQSTGGYFATGTEIQWSDCTGTNGQWNVATNDIWFAGNPTVCGVFRAEFIDWGGHDWRLYTNCTGTNQPGFRIYDNICEAFENYNPLPELSISNAVLSGSCPNYTVNFDITNVGCLQVNDAPVRLAAALDPNNFTDIVIPGTLLPGDTMSAQIQLTLTSSLPQNLTLSADPSNTVGECSEGGGSLVACNVTSGAHSVDLPVCTDCVVFAQGVATPAAVCSGSGTILNAVGSSIPTCVAPLEYRYRDQFGNVLSDWTLNKDSYILDPTQYPTADENYQIDVRCSDKISCSGTARVPVTVAFPPVMGIPTAADLGPCTTGIRVDWAAAKFNDVSQSGLYNIYRSTTGCPAPIPANLLATGVAGLFYPDGSTAPNTSYTYLVEAEDASTNGPCPQGPNNQGAVNSQCIAGPVLDVFDDQPLVDPPQPWNVNAPQPLRAIDKGDDWVSFGWPTWPLPEPDGNFVMFRSSTVSGPFIEVTPPGGIQTLTMTDSAAPAILYYYDLRFRDLCGNLSNDWEPPDFPLPATCGVIDLTCGVPVASDSRSPCVSNFASHTCFPKNATGMDRVHVIRLTQKQDLFARLSNTLTDVDVYIYDSQQNCLTWGDAEADLFQADPGIYFIVVDSPGGQEGIYTLLPDCQ